MGFLGQVRRQPCSRATRKGHFPQVTLRGEDHRLAMHGRVAEVTSHRLGTANVRQGRQQGIQRGENDHPGQHASIPFLQIFLASKFGEQAGTTGTLGHGGKLFPYPFEQPLRRVHACDFRESTSLVLDPHVIVVTGGNNDLHHLHEVGLGFVALLVEVV